MATALERQIVEVSQAIEDWETMLAPLSLRYFYRDDVDGLREDRDRAELESLRRRRERLLGMRTMSADAPCRPELCIEDAARGDRPPSPPTLKRLLSTTVSPADDEAETACVSRQAPGDGVEGARSRSPRRIGCVSAPDGWQNECRGGAPR